MECGESREVRSKSMLESTAPKARSRSRTGVIMNGAPRISPRCQGNSPSLAHCRHWHRRTSATSTFARTFASSLSSCQHPRMVARAVPCTSAPHSSLRHLRSESSSSEISILRDRMFIK